MAETVLIRIDTIKELPSDHPFSEPVESFPILLEMQEKGECTFRDTVTGLFSVWREYDHIKVTGSAHVPVSLPCSRCLNPVETVIRSNFTVIYRKESAQAGVLEDETELTEDDLVSALYSGDELDIAREIEMQVAMGVPVKPLCSSSCKGLCPGCGVNLTHESCVCSDSTESTPFSILKNFNVAR